ncbi:MAG: hypothetical protein GAK43_00664 [Stenotrophomonas maltophilia]|nr:MAG: hypothetical protein GAK43_00664 [Stenotrophomonas maltophilia]
MTFTMINRNSRRMKRALLLLTILTMAACTTPARIYVPDDDTVDAGKRAMEELARIPPTTERVRIGDQLRIVRNSGETPTLSAFNVSTIYELTLYTVANDGTINYPFIGPVSVVHKTPDEVGKLITSKLVSIYQQPQVTVNINQAPSNTVFVGGAVRQPSALPIPAAATIDQAIIGAGGVLSVADSTKVALLREDETGLYHTYFLDYSRLLMDGGHRSVQLQRGDVVFVPKSNVGNRVEGVDIYMNQLIPFVKTIGVSATYSNVSNSN